MKHLMCATIVLSVLYLIKNGVQCGRQERETPSLAQSDAMLWDQLLAATNEHRDAAYDELDYNRRQPNYLLKWPGLRDLLLTAFDYDNMNTNNNNNNNNESNNLDSKNLNDHSNGYEIANSRLMERLRQLAETSSFGMDLENIRQNEVENEGALVERANPPSQFDLKVRKQIMAPCHFKVCYIGRKRNVRY